jgi:hypothetical protein
MEAPDNRHERRRVALTTLLDLLQHASARQTSWAAWVESLSDVLGTAPVLLALGSPRAGGVVVTAGIAAEFHQAYVQRYSACDPWVACMAAMPSRIVFGYEVLPRPLLRRSEFYTAWMAPQGFQDVPTINGVIRDQSNRLSVLSIFRTRSTPVLQVEDLALLREVLPQLRRALSRQAHPPRRGLSIDLMRRCA